MGVARLAGVAMLVVLALAGCKVDATVGIDMAEDGSGVVRVVVALDAEAVQTAEVGGGTLDQRIRLADLTAAGWTVGPWQRAADGSATIRATKSFASPDELAGIIAEIGGASGPLHDFSAKRTRRLLQTDYALSGTIDMANLGTGVAGDAELVASLTRAGVDVGALDAVLQEALRTSFSLRVVVDLPGRAPVAITVPPGEQRDVALTASVRDDRRLALGIAAVVLAVVGVALVVWPRRTRARRNRRRARREARLG